MSKKTPTTSQKPAESGDDQTVWLRLWASAISAWMVGVDPDGPKETDWHGFGPELELARVCFCLEQGGPDWLADRVEEARDDEEGDGFASLPKPKGFKSWPAVAAEAFARLGLNADTSKLQVGQIIRWSPYHLTLVRDPKDKLYDERVLQPLNPGTVASVRAYRGNYEPLMAVVRKRQLVVANGRQRTRAAIHANFQDLTSWLEDLEQLMGSGGEVSPATAIPPKLIHTLECVVRPLEEAVALKNLANSSGVRTNETVLQEARCAWELEDLGHKTGQIAQLRGASEQTIRNYLSLRKLIEEFRTALADGSVSVKAGYRLARETQVRQTNGWKHLEQLEEAVTREVKAKLGYVPPSYEAEQRSQRDRRINAWLDGEPTEQEALPNVPPKIPTAQKAKAHDRLESLRLHMRRIPRNPMGEFALHLIGAVLGEPEALEKMPPPLRAGLTNAWQFFTARDRDSWNAAGVWDPATIEVLNDALHTNKDPGEDDADDDPNEMVTPEDAGRPWAEGLTLGAAVELGRLTPRGFRVALRQQQMALGEAQLFARLESGQHTDIGNGDTDRVARENMPPPEEGRRWGAFLVVEWQAADIWDEDDAAELGAAGLTPGDLRRKHQSGHTLGDMFATGTLGIKDIKVGLLTAHVEQVNEDAPVTAGATSGTARAGGRRARKPPQREVNP